MVMHVCISGTLRAEVGDCHRFHIGLGDIKFWGHTQLYSKTLPNEKKKQ